MFYVSLVCAFFSIIVNNVCFAFDFYGDPEFVKLTQAHEQELAMQNAVAQAVLHNNELAQGAAYMTSFFGAAYALGGYCVALSCAKNHALKKRFNACYRVVAAAGALCMGAYAGYQIPTEVWQSTGNAEKMLYASMLSEVGSVCIGAAIGALSS